MCGPRETQRRARPGRTRARVRLGRGRKTVPTDGALLLATERESERALGRIGPGGRERAGVENGPREGFLGHGVKERDGLGEKRKDFAFF